MKMVRLRKKYINIKNSIIIIALIIIFITSILLSTIGKKASNNMLYISRNIINTICTNTVNNNIKLDLLKNYNINDLIKVSYLDNKISNIDYNLESAYEVLIQIKSNIINNIGNNMQNIYNYDYIVQNNNVIIEMPFYNYTNNLLLANLGPKIKVKLSMVRLVDGSIKTKVKTYGINSLLVELYINFTVTSTIVIPNEKETNNVQKYDVLISSKVIQGEIPSIYNGLLEKSSDIIST